MLTLGDLEAWMSMLAGDKAELDILDGHKMITSPDIILTPISFCLCDITSMLATLLRSSEVVACSNRCGCQLHFCASPSNTKGQCPVSAPRQASILHILCSLELTL